MKNFRNISVIQTPETMLWSSDTGIGRYLVIDSAIECDYNHGTPKQKYPR